MPKYNTPRIEKTECAEMFNAVKSYLGISELRFKHYSLYNEFTSKQRHTLTEPMYNRLVDLYYTTFPSTKKEVPYDKTVKDSWLKTLTVYKESSDFVNLSESRKEKIRLEIYRLKEMIN